MSARRGYYSSDILRYSFFNNGGVYEISGENLVNILTGEKFFVMTAGLGRSEISMYRDFIHSSPLCGCYAWPVDVVELKNEDEAVFTRVFIKRRKGTSLAGFLFPFKHYPVVRNLHEVIEDENFSSKELAVLTVKTIDSLNRCGYGYGVMESSSLLFTEDGRIIPGFTPSLFSWMSLYRGGLEDGLPRKEDYSPDFAPPAYVNGIIPKTDLDCQNHSLRALLFYILTGRYPYDGSLLSGYSSDTPFYRQIKFRDYHKYAVFIFDQEDRSNSVGQFREERQAVEAWNGLPRDIKELFSFTLKKETALRQNSRRCPRPCLWLEAFARAGWCK